VISSNERPVFQRISSWVMEVISRRWYYTIMASMDLFGTWIVEIGGQVAVEHSPPDVLILSA
jgi:hypothetical protein